MPVSIDDIAAVLGRSTPTDAELTQWEIWISDALMLIEARLVGVGTGQVASLADLDQTRLEYVVREAVVAHIRRPDDATTVEVAVDDARASRTYRTSSGRITIRDEWWNLLSPTGSGSGTAFSIFPGRSHNCHDDVCSANRYVDANGNVVFGGAYCTCGADIAGYPIYGVGY